MITGQTAFPTHCAILFDLSYNPSNARLKLSFHVHVYVMLIQMFHVMLILDIHKGL